MGEEDKKRFREWLRDRVIDDLETDFIELIEQVRREMRSAVIDEVITRAESDAVEMGARNSEAARGAWDIIASIRRMK